MASSRNASSSSDDLRERVARALPAMPPRSRLLLGLSGGVDSVALLELLAQIAPGRFSLSALHVNHGISPNAAAAANVRKALQEALRGLADKPIDELIEERFVRVMGYGKFKERELE